MIRNGASGLATSGYYITFCRLPTLGLDAWKAAFDDFAEDGVDTVVLWMAGAFASRKYPITWQYNSAHRNVQENFAGRLIDHAHSVGIDVLLGFSPFTYDGANQYAYERPDLKAVRAGGAFARIEGIHSYGYGLNPARGDAMTFMREYVHEMYTDFYPSADGLLIESSDIDICACDDCAGRYYEREYELVVEISCRVWNQNPEAQIMVHPNYFAANDGHDLPLDPRWTVVFGGLNAPLDADLITRASKTLYFDLNLISKLPANIKQSIQTVRNHGIDGYQPSHEFFTYLPTRPEMGEPGVVGKQLRPFGMELIQVDENPCSDPLVMVNRVAFRSYRDDPDQSDDDFRTKLGQAVFGDNTAEELIDTLLVLHECYYRGRSLFSPAAQVDPHVLRDDLERGRLSAADLSRMLVNLERLPVIIDRLGSSRDATARRLEKHAQIIERNWDSDSLRLLRAHMPPSTG